jgi:hypothetical protein
MASSGSDITIGSDNIEAGTIGLEPCETGEAETVTCPVEPLETGHAPFDESLMASTSIT